MKPKTLIIWGTVLGGLAVTLGAFGAHALDTKLLEWYPDSVIRARKEDAWEIGVRYQMYHALALLAIGAIALQQPRKLFGIAGWFFLGGVMFFSGSLYILVLFDIKIFGMIAAIGGTLQIIAWLLTVVGALSLTARVSDNAR